MLPYILMLAIPFLFCMIAFQKKKQMILGGIAVDKKLIDSINWALPVFFTILFLLLALRHEMVGSDTVGYVSTFHWYRSLNLREMFFQTSDYDSEILFMLLNWGVGQFTENFQWVLVVSSAIMMLPIFFLYAEDREHSFMKIILFVNMATFITMFSGIRQMLAVSMGVLAYFCARKKRWFWFLVVVAVATGFHTSGIMILAIYPLYHISFRRKHLWLIVPAIVLILIFNGPIFLFLANNVYGAYLGETEVVTTTETGAYTTLILFIVFSIIAYVLPDEEKMDKEALALRSILILATALQTFSLVHVLAMRINYYFIVFIPVAMARLLPCAKDEFKAIARWLEGAIIIFFTAYFLYVLWREYSTGISTLRTIPYVPFWQEY